MPIEFNTVFFRYLQVIRRGVQPDGEDRHIEFLLLDTVIGGRIPDPDVVVFGVLSGDRGIAPYKPYPIELLGPLVVSFEILAVGTNVVVKHGTLGFPVMILGQNDLFLGIGAADARAIAVFILSNPS